MEALCSGVPIVLSDVDGAREQIGGQAERGYLVTHPLGDPLNVNWASIGAARYTPQINRGEFAKATAHLVSDRDGYLSRRQRLANKLIQRFSADQCLARHAAVLIAAANGAELVGQCYTYPVRSAPSGAPPPSLDGVHARVPVDVCEGGGAGVLGDEAAAVRPDAGQRLPRRACRADR